MMAIEEINKNEKNGVTKQNVEGLAPPTEQKGSPRKGPRKGPRKDRGEHPLLAGAGTRGPVKQKKKGIGRGKLQELFDSMLVSGKGAVRKEKLVLAAKMKGSSSDSVGTLLNKQRRLGNIRVSDDGLITRGMGVEKPATKRKQSTKRAATKHGQHTTKDKKPSVKRTRRGTAHQTASQVVKHAAMTAPPGPFRIRRIPSLEEMNGILELSAAFEKLIDLGVISIDTKGRRG